MDREIQGIPTNFTTQADRQQVTQEITSLERKISTWWLTSLLEKISKLITNNIGTGVPWILRQPPLSVDLISLTNNTLIYGYTWLQFKNFWIVWYTSL